MGLPLTMTPNYEDFSCQFAFGKTPGPQDTDEAFISPCFAQCPTKRAAAVFAAAAAAASVPAAPAGPAAVVEKAPACHKIEVDSTP